MSQTAPPGARPTVSQAADRSGTSVGERAMDGLSRYGLILLLVLVVAAFSALSPESYFTTSNLRLILVNESVVVLIALAAATPLMAHNLDASVGPMAGLAQGVAVWAVAVKGWSVWMAVLAVLVVAVIVGSINAALVVVAKMSSIVVTLATGSLLAGALLWLTGGRVIFQGIPPAFTELARGDFLGIPRPLWYLVALVIVLELVIVWSPVGQRLYAMDGNLRGAERAGIPVTRYTWASFVVAAVIAGIAGLLLASRVGSAQPEMGSQFLLPAFAAAFLGQATLRPGRINILGTVVAAYFVSFTIAGLQHLGARAWVEHAFNGLAVLVGVAVAQVAVSRRKKAAILHVSRMEGEV